MKTLFLSLMMIPVANTFAMGGYRCEGYCGGIDTQWALFYDGGYISTEQPDTAQQAFKSLLKKCERLMPFGIQPRIYKNLEVSRYDRRESETWSTRIQGYEILRDYRMVRILPYSESSEYRYHHSETQNTIKIESATSKDSCEFDSSITVPYYEGDLPVQG